ncbi:MAG: DUF4384 domain-containing protein [Gemmatimonadota bacterium]
MRSTRTTRLGVVLGVAMLVGGRAPVDAQTFVEGARPTAVDAVDARVWLDRARSSIVRAGEEVRLYYRANFDAYAAIVRVDTEGHATLIYPQDPSVEGVIGAGRDYRLIFREGSRWRVRDAPGRGHFFIIASHVPLDIWQFDFQDGVGWQLGELGRTTYDDPYLAVDDFVEVLLPDWETTAFALNLLPYDVGRIP